MTAIVNEIQDNKKLQGSLRDATCPICGSTKSTLIMSCPDVGDNGYWIMCADCKRQYPFGNFWKDRKDGLI